MEINAFTYSPSNWQIDDLGGGNYTLTHSITKESYVSINIAAVNAKILEKMNLGVTEKQFSLNSLISGEDQVNNWLATVNGATQYKSIVAVGNGAGNNPNSNVLLGNTGAMGDYLKSIIVNVTAATDAYVNIQDGAAATPVSGTALSGTTLTTYSAVTTLSLTTAGTLNIVANQFKDYILTLTYTPTSGVPTVIKRKILSHAASSNTIFAPVIDHATPAGAAPVSWAVEPLSSMELIPYNQPVGVYTIPLDIKSAVGAWRISVGSTVRVVASGKFTS